MVWVHTRKQEFRILFVELVVIAFMGSVAFVAHVTGLAAVLFPELAALSHDVLRRPTGEWARQPLQLVLAPTLTAAFGLLCTRHIPYADWSILLIVAVSLGVIRLLRCSMSPAISAGVLPLVLHEQSWFYPLAIFFDLSLLALLLLLRKRQSSGIPRIPDNNVDAQVIDTLEAPPQSRFWGIAFISFVAIVGAAAQVTGLRFLLFPPLIVMTYELFGHPTVPGWMKRPALLPIVCLITAGIGVLAVRFVHPFYLGVCLTIICSIAVLRLFDLHMPPALAIGIIPFVIERPNMRYAASVLVGTVLLMLSYSIYRRLLGKEKRLLS